MENINVKPICCTNSVNNSVSKNCNTLIVGKCGRDYYTSNLIFDPIILDENVYIKKAELFMYCEELYSCNKINVYVEKNEIKNTITNIGWYKWDVSSIFKDSHVATTNLYIYTDDLISCGLCKFTSIKGENKPYIVITLEKDHHKHNIINIVEEHSTADIYNYTSWFKCIDIDDYFYFVKNIGKSDVEVIVQISPDKINTFIDNGPYIIKPNDTQSIIPLRRSFFVRLAFRNATQTNSKIKVWLQGVRNN